MKQIRNFLFPVIALLVAGCSSRNEETPIAPPADARLPIRISAQMSDTRATDYGFQNADRVGLYVVYANGQSPAWAAAHVNNMGFTYNGGAWTPDSPIYWQDNTTAADFYLYYPYRSAVADAAAIPVTAAADQSTEAAYRAADVLVGVAKNVSPTEDAVAITANHVMSQAVITVLPGNGFTGESLQAATVTVSLNGIRTMGTLNLADGQVTASGTATGVTPWKDGDSYRAIILPQHVENGNLVTINIDGKDYNLKRPFDFVGGRRHTLPVTVAKTGSGINVTIGQWQDDETDNGGVAE